VVNATVVIWQTLLIADKTFRRSTRRSCSRTSQAAASPSTECGENRRDASAAA
jgi:hypothetical protein